MKALLVSSYELGHQPLHVASPAASLRRAGHAVRCRDLSVQDWDESDIDWADAVAFSVPMHTAMRLAVHATKRIHESHPDLPICFYGLYANIGNRTRMGPAVKTIAGEYEAELLAWLDSRASDMKNPVPGQPVVDLARQEFQVPARADLPRLDGYARLAVGAERRLAGYVEASHGCVHRCTHCPVPAVYDGKIRIVAHEVVLEDIANLVSMGAKHITFGDPDFLNGPRHSLRIVRSMHEKFPDLTFDCTTKVQHILRHETIWSEMAGSGCVFVVSAFECFNDKILDRLDKGHTARDAERAVELLRRHGIEPRPSFLPFTPWTEFQDIFDILDFVAANDLVGNVDPIQYTIRLLVPRTSLLHNDPNFGDFFGDFDEDRLSYAWQSMDPRLDALQNRLVKIAEHASQQEESSLETFIKIGEAVVGAAGTGSARSRIEFAAPSVDRRAPRLTEPWFC